MSLRRSLPFAALLLALLAGLVPLGSAVASPSSASTTSSDAVTLPGDGFGFTDGMTVLGLSDADLNRELDAVVAAGGTWLRMPINWSYVEPTQGTYRWPVEDRVVAAARAHGLRVLGVVAYAPAWARPRGSSAQAPPTDPAPYADFAAAVARHFGSDVAAYELWNEPNLAQFWGGRPDAVAYTHLLQAAYPAIKAVSPEATVVSGGLSRDGVLPSTYVAQMYAAGAGGYFDALGLHPYLSATNPAPAFAALAAQLTTMRATMVAAGDATKQMWFTEFGSSTYLGGPSAQQQADLALAQLSYASLTPFVGPCILYTIRDTGSDPALSASNFGELLQYNWEPTVLAQTLNAAAASTSSATPVSLAAPVAAQITVGDAHPAVEGAKTLTFPVTLRDAQAHTGYSVRLSTVNGTARSGADYASVSRTVVFAPDGPTTQLVTVRVIDDRRHESTESLGVVLTRPGTTGTDAVELGQARATGVITDDDPARR